MIVRSDSSASYGTQTVRWRIVGDSLALALGGEWVNYRLKLKGKNLTLSGGDLHEPVTFQRVGPPTPRPDSVGVPPDPEHPTVVGRTRRDSGVPGCVRPSRIPRLLQRQA